MIILFNEETSDEQTKDRHININIINDRKPEIIQERKVIEEPKDIMILDITLEET